MVPDLTEIAVRQPHALPMNEPLFGVPQEDATELWYPVAPVIHAPTAISARISVVQRLEGAMWSSAFAKLLVHRLNWLAIS